MKNSILAQLVAEREPDRFCALRPRFQASLIPKNRNTVDMNRPLRDGAEAMNVKGLGERRLQGRGMDHFVQAIRYRDEVL